MDEQLKKRESNYQAEGAKMTEKQAEEIIEYLRDIKISLEGNTKLGIEGAFKMLHRHESWINKMNLKMAMWAGIGTVVGAGASPAVKTLWHMVSGN